MIIATLKMWLWQLACSRKVKKNCLMQCIIRPLKPGGGVFEREVELPDWVFDYWHPLEKAQYPEFFAKHEDRKNQFVAWWEKQHGKADPKYLYD
ncbi:NADH dehydrogenase [ubiquinone] 1 beta subcomplex subunit 9-like isoform 2-T6 [Glossina fuscipes fuscipes]